MVETLRASSDYEQCLRIKNRWNFEGQEITMMTMIVMKSFTTPDIHHTLHPLTWIQRKSHRFGQGAHDCGCKSEQDPAELVLRFKTWALYSVRCPCPNL